MTVKKSAAVKKLAKKPAIKKTVAKKMMAVKNPSPDNSAIKSIFTKSQILTEIARESLLSKKEVISVLEGLTHLISRHIKKGAVGLFNMPGLFKIITVHKPATKARKGINPFNGEATVFKAKPARTVVKVRALKGLKDMA